MSSLAVSGKNPGHHRPEHVAPPTTELPTVKAPRRHGEGPGIWLSTVELGWVAFVSGIIGGLAGVITAVVYLRFLIT